MYCQGLGPGGAATGIVRVTGGGGGRRAAGGWELGGTAQQEVGEEGRTGR